MAAVDADETAALTTFVPPWDRCYDFVNIFAKKSKKIVAILTKNIAVLCPKIKKIDL
jgi:hypothetical protein